MEYKFKQSIQSDLDRLDDLNGDGSLQYEEKVKEMNEVYAKAEAFDELSALIAKRYEAEKDRAGYTADQYTQGVYYTLNNLNGVARDLERSDSEC